MATTTKRTTSTNKSAAKKDISEQVKATEGLFTLEQVQAMIDEAVKNAVQSVAMQPVPAVHEVTDDTVVMRFFAEVNDSNVVQFGRDSRYGQVTGKHATVVVSKNDFVGGFRDMTAQTLLKNRTLVVLSGLTDAERALYGVDYEEGEIMTPDECDRMDKIGKDILKIYPRLHPTFKTMIARRFREKAENGTLSIDRETLVELNRLSRADQAGVYTGGMKNEGNFIWIIEKMNQEDRL